MLTITQILLLIAATCSTASIAKEVRHAEMQYLQDDVNADMTSEQAADNEVYKQPGFENYDISSESNLEAEASKTISVQNFGVGTVIRLSYTAPGPAQGSWLLLNLVSSTGDILLHFNPRYYASGPVLVLNSFLDNAWGAEERPTGFPFDATTVYVVVVVEESGYRITVNGGAFQYLYNHRRTSLVTSISTDLDNVFYGAVVSSNDLPNDKIGKVVYINGVIPASDACGGASCAINLINAPPSLLAAPLFSATSPNTALHFNPRFYATIVVRNSLIGGAWGPEETAGGIPFTPNTAFNVAVTHQQNGYEIAVNGDHFTTYQYRLPLTTPVTVLVNSAMLGPSAKIQVV